MIKFHTDSSGLKIYIETKSQNTVNYFRFCCDGDGKWNFCDNCNSADLRQLADKLDELNEGTT